MKKWRRKSAARPSPSRPAVSPGGGEGGRKPGEGNLFRGLGESEGY